MLASKNLPQPITQASEGQHWIRVLAAELALRLNDARQVNTHLWPKTLVLHARLGYEAARSKQIPFPFTRDVSVDVIATAGNKLWKELVGNSTAIKVTNVSLAFTGIEISESGQQSIDGFFKPGQPHKRTLEEDHGDSHDASAPDIEVDPGRTRNDTSVSFTCARCGKQIALSQAQLDDIVADSAQALGAMRMEHEDYHFAQDLARQSSNETSFNNERTKKKRRKEPKGIEKFFKKQM